MVLFEKDSVPAYGPGDYRPIGFHLMPAHLAHRQCIDDDVKALIAKRWLREIVW